MPAALRTYAENEQDAYILPTAGSHLDQLVDILLLRILSGSPLDFLPGIPSCADEYDAGVMK